MTNHTSHKAVNSIGKPFILSVAIAAALAAGLPAASAAPKNARRKSSSRKDPVKRYQHYEKAFLAGELDAAFKDFSTWEYRMVVECDAPDDILSWGREMLRAYRRRRRSRSKSR